MPIKICLIGAGHMGRIHAQKLVRMKDVRLTRIVDADPTRAAEEGLKHGVPSADDFNDVLSNGLQAAVVASPTETHFPVARRLLEEGVHVFVEKPIATNPDEAQKLINLASKKGLILQVGHLERFSPAFRRALPLIDRPYSIEARRTSGFTGRSTDIDVIYDLMIHDIDLVMSLTQSKVERIVAYGTRVLTDRIDVAKARIEFADGAVATLTASRVSGTKERSVEIVQKNRYFALNLAEGSMYLAERDITGKRRVRAYATAHPDPVNDELRSFINVIKGRGTTLVSGQDGLRALTMAETIKKLIEEHIVNE
jgi:predicted dehydrogenase